MIVKRAPFGFPSCRAVKNFTEGLAVWRAGQFGVARKQLARLQPALGAAAATRQPDARTNRPLFRKIVPL